jgi:hypothetical protein
MIVCPRTASGRGRQRPRGDIGRDCFASVHCSAAHISAARGLYSSKRETVGAEVHADPELRERVSRALPPPAARRIRAIPARHNLYRPSMRLQTLAFEELSA